MISFISLDTNVFNDANNIEANGLQLLENILKNISVNCAILTFEDYHQITEIASIVKDYPDIAERKTIKTFISWLEKNKRFVSVLQPDYTGEKSDLEQLNEQYDQFPIELILLSEKNLSEYEWEIEKSSIWSYNKTRFEMNRFESSKGVILEDDEIDENILIKQFFEKMILFANEINICDYSFGKNFREDYEYSWGKLVSYIDNMNLSSPISINIYTNYDNSSREKYFVGYIQTRKLNSISSINIYMFQDNIQNKLPHERYLYTENFAFDIGRGMDFISKQSKKNRRTKFSIVDLSKVRKILLNCVQPNLIHHSI